MYQVLTESLILLHCFSSNNLDDPTGLNQQYLYLGTKNRATLRYALQGGADGYTIARPDILGGYDLFSDPETVDIDYLLMGSIHEWY